MSNNTMDLASLLTKFFKEGIKLDQHYNLHNLEACKCGRCNSVVDQVVTGFVGKMKIEEYTAIKKDVLNNFILIASNRHGLPLH